MGLDLAMGSPGEVYRDYLREAVKSSGKTQSQVAIDAEIEPGNFSNILGGRRKPLRDYKKNLALVQACGKSKELAQDLQNESEAYYAISSQPRGFRRQMAITVRVLEELIDYMTGEIEAMQDYVTKRNVVREEENQGEVDNIDQVDQVGQIDESYKDDEVTIYVPESLVAVGKILNSLRYWWPIEPGEDWKDYPDISGRLLRKLSKLSPEKQENVVVQMEVSTALEWVEDADLDQIVERETLIRRLARSLDIKEQLFVDIVRSLGKLANEGKRPSKGTIVLPFSIRSNKGNDSNQE